MLTGTVTQFLETAKRLRIGLPELFEQLFAMLADEDFAAANVEEIVDLLLEVFGDIKPAHKAPHEVLLRMAQTVDGNLPFKLLRLSLIINHLETNKGLVVPGTALAFLNGNEPPEGTNSPYDTMFSNIFNQYPFINWGDFLSREPFNIVGFGDGSKRELARFLGPLGLNLRMEPMVLERDFGYKHPWKELKETSVPDLLGKNPGDLPGLAEDARRALKSSGINTWEDVCRLVISKEYGDSFNFQLGDRNHRNMLLRFLKLMGLLTLTEEGTPLLREHLS